MVPPQPLAAELEMSSKGELLIPSSAAPRFSVQFCLICFSRETPLFDKEILTFLGGPLRQAFPAVSFLFILEFLGLTFDCTFSSRFRETDNVLLLKNDHFPENRWKSCRSAYPWFYFLTFYLIIGVEDVKCAWSLSLAWRSFLSASGDNQES